MRYWAIPTKYSALNYLAFVADHHEKLTQSQNAFQVEDRHGCYVEITVNDVPLQYISKDHQKTDSIL